MLRCYYRVTCSHGYSAAPALKAPLHASLNTAQFMHPVSFDINPHRDQQRRIFYAFLQQRCVNELLDSEQPSASSLDWTGRPSLLNSSSLDGRPDRAECCRETGLPVG